MAISAAIQNVTSRVFLATDDKASFCFSLCLFADSLSPPVNVTIRALKANSAVVTWDIPEGDSVIGFAITQQVINIKYRQQSHWKKHTLNANTTVTGQIDLLMQV